MRYLKAILLLSFTTLTLSLPFALFVSGAAASPLVSGWSAPVDVTAPGLQAVVTPTQTITGSDRSAETTGATEPDPIDLTDYEALVPDPLPPRTDLPIWVNLGDPITYTFRITNVGPVRATDVYFADPLPAEVSLQSVSSTRGSCAEAEEITCDLGTMHPDDTAVITIVVTPTATGLVSNTPGRVGSREIDPAKSKTYRTKLYIVVPAANDEPAVTAPDAVDEPANSSSPGLKLYMPVVVKEGSPN